jgi:hypothetical protein
LESVAVNMRTGTLSRQNEIVSRQIERGARRRLSPARSGMKTEVWTRAMLVTDEARRLLS